LPSQALYERTQKCIQRGYSAIFEFFISEKEHQHLLLQHRKRNSFYRTKTCFPKSKKYRIFSPKLPKQAQKRLFWTKIHSKNAESGYKTEKILLIQIVKNLKPNRLKQNEVVSAIYDDTFGINRGKEKNAPKG